METSHSPTTGHDRVTHGIIVGFSTLTLLVHLLTNSRYGYFRDELYFLACSRHLAFGYVDMAPLCAWILRLQTILFGDSLFALRLFPAIAGGLTVALTGVLTQALGGRRWAVTLAATAAMSALVYLGVGNFYSMNVFEPLFWMGCVYLLIRILQGGSQRLWLLFGVVAGLGLENKHSLVFFGAALVLALLVTPARRQFAQPCLWLGGLIALAIALPNLLWQMQHGFPTRELLTNVARSNKNVVLSPAAFVLQQVLIMNPATAFLWLSGLGWLLCARNGRPYLSLGIAYLVALGLFIIMHGKHYYYAPVYPMLFAAGGVAWEGFFAFRWRWTKPALVSLILLVGALLAPTLIPILPPEKLLAYMRAIHFEPPKTETSHTAALPQLFADQFGWEEMTNSVARAYRNLSVDDQKRVGIFCQNYGQAGAIDFFGARLSLPPALSGHQNYYLWGPRGYSGEVMLVLDTPGGDEPAQFESVEDLGLVDSSPWAMPWEQRTHLYLCRGLKGSLSELWPKVKVWL